MARFFSGLFGNSQQTQPPATALRVNSSLQGVPIALLLGGANRLAGNLLDYFNFTYQNAPTQGGGKGGLFSAGTGKGNSGQYVYFVSFILGICEGPAGLSAVWMNGTPKEFPPTGSTGIVHWGGTDNFFGEFFVGDYAQAPWGGFPEPTPFTGLGQAVPAGHGLSYRGIA